MDEQIKNAVEEYQCPGCMQGEDSECYKKDKYSESCTEHIAGTLLAGAGSIYLGLPIGFNRMGTFTDMLPHIYKHMMILNCFLVNTIYIIFQCGNIKIKTGMYWCVEFHQE